MFTRTLQRAVGLACICSCLPASAAVFLAGDAAQLISAINTANAAPGADTIRLTADITLTTAHNTNFGNNGLPVITSDITLDGAGFQLLRSGPVPDNVVAPDRFRFVLVTSGTVKVVNLRFVSGNASDTEGGAIHARSGTNLEIRNCTFVGNASFGTLGGAVASSGASLLVSNSTFTGNANGNAANNFVRGGAIGADSVATVRVENSTFENNVAQSSAIAEGGAIHIFGGSPYLSGNVFVNNQAVGPSVISGGGALMIDTPSSAATVINNTFSANVGSFQGGAIKANSGTMNIAGNTLIGNSGSSGGGIFHFVATVNLNGNIIAGNTATTGPNCHAFAGTLSGANNGSDTAECQGSFAVVVGTDVDVSLANNGGPTRTHALLPGSAAVDVGWAGCPATDQRGAGRLGSCDAGAYELRMVTLPTVAFSAGSATYNEAVSPATIDLAVSGAAGFSGIAEVYVVDTGTGNATLGTDYTFPPLQTVTIDCSSGTCPPTVSFGMPILPDALYEGNETVVLAIAGTNGLVTPAAPTIHTATINNTTTLAASISASTMATENPPTNGRFVVVLSAVNNSGIPVTVFYSVGGTATPGVDFVPLSGSVIIPDGQSAANIDIVPINDPDIEAPETVIVTLLGTDHAGITAGGSATLMISDGLEFPGVATGLASSAGDSQALISFSAAPDGGSPIVSYQASCTPGPFTGTAAASPITVTGLTNGTLYSCTVRATNGVGQGAASAAVGVTPVSTPGAPTVGVATPGNGQASIAFTPPGVTGGSPITSYQATCNPGSITGTSVTSPVVVTGLTNGTTYGCTVVAINLQGPSPASGVATVTPRTVPGAPTGVAATPGNGAATITFTAPANGGSAITGYTATCNPGPIAASGPASPLTVPGLTNGTAYSCSVTATNGVGTGLPSTPASVTPSFNVFSGPSATGSGTITASFTGGGGACTFSAPQFIGAPPGAPPIPPTSPVAGIQFPHGLFDFSATGCTPGSTLTFTIVYPASIGRGVYWKYGPTTDNPAPHWYVMPATLTGNTATFTITDGGLGDDDLTANGTIVDQGGPGVPPGELRQVPTLSEWGRLLLALLLLASAAWTMRGRSR